MKTKNKINQLDNNQNKKLTTINNIFKGKIKAALMEKEQDVILILKRHSEKNKY